MSFYKLIETLYREQPYPCSLAPKDNPNLPLAYINSAFENLTGFSKKEALGRNCRFLNTKFPNQKNLATLRDAIRRENPILVDLKNQSKAGRVFGNRLILLPIDYDDESYYLGLQNEVPLEKLRCNKNADKLGHIFLNGISSIISLYETSLNELEFRESATTLLSDLYRQVKEF